MLEHRRVVARLELFSASADTPHSALHTAPLVPQHTTAEDLAYHNISKAEPATHTTRAEILLREPAAPPPTAKGDLKQRRAELQAKLKEDPTMRVDKTPPHRRQSEVVRRRKQLQAKLQARVHGRG